MSRRRRRKPLPAAEGPCGIINASPPVSRLQSPPGRSRMPTRLGNNSHQFTSPLCAAPPLWYSAKDLFFFAAKQAFSRRDLLVRPAPLFIPLWRHQINLTYTSDTDFFKNTPTPFFEYVWKEHKGSASTLAKTGSPSISVYQQLPNSATDAFQAGNTDGFFRTHLVVGGPAHTADSIHVCRLLITAFVVWSVKAVKWERGV